MNQLIQRLVESACPNHLSPDELSFIVAVVNKIYEGVHTQYLETIRENERLILTLKSMDAGVAAARESFITACHDCQQKPATPFDDDVICLS